MLSLESPELFPYLHQENSESVFPPPESSPISPIVVIFSMLIDDPIPSRHESLQQMWILPELQSQTFFHHLLFNIFPIMSQWFFSLIASFQGFIGIWSWCYIVFFGSAFKLFGLKVMLIRAINVVSFFERRVKGIGKLSVSLHRIIEVDRFLSYSLYFYFRCSLAETWFYRWWKHFIDNLMM